jgi:hypothetical protein
MLAILHEKESEVAVDEVNEVLNALSFSWQNARPQYDAGGCGTTIMAQVTLPCISADMLWFLLWI